ncbi:MAG: hypothetical protein KDD62_03040, partial [Bdellovibrionales bacterium]|nr:hypothetical protein [Bdellovibrionales bacterium]
ALPNIAPSGLYISDLRFKKMDLDSGEIVGVIAGTLHNDTSEEFKTVVLEGLGFDEEGNAVSSVRITAGAGLGSAKVKSLSREMINDLQARPPIKKFSLAPQDSYSFSIALTEHKPEKLAHYSARVYSVVR